MAIGLQVINRKIFCICFGFFLIGYIYCDDDMKKHSDECILRGMGGMGRFN